MIIAEVVSSPHALHAADHGFLKVKAFDSFVHGLHGADGLLPFFYGTLRSRAIRVIRVPRSILLKR